MTRIALAILSLCAVQLGAQTQRAVRVQDDAGHPVGYAQVQVSGGNPRIADSTGTLALRSTEDSLNLVVKRIGHQEFRGWARRSGDAYLVVLPRLAANLSSVEVTAAGSTTNTVLVQRGFYDRVDRVQKGAILGDFFSPEALDSRPFSKVSQMIAGSRYGRVEFVAVGARRVAVITGRGGCRMTILLDGDHVQGTVQDADATLVPQSLMAGSTYRPPPDPSAPSIDDVVDGRSVMAIEIYPSTGNAPVELVRTSGRGSCGIVALWTGGRR